MKEQIGTHAPAAPSGSYSQATVHLAEMALFTAFDAVYASYFPDPKPARTTVGSELLGIPVEIDVVADASR